MRGHFFVGPIDAWLIPARLGHTGLQIVRHYDLGYAPHKLEGAHVRTDPIGQSLGQARFGIGIATGAQHGDKQSRLPHLPGDGAIDGNGVAGIVDKQFLAGPVFVP